MKTKQSKVTGFIPIKSIRTQKTRLPVLAFLIWLAMTTAMQAQVVAVSDIIWGSGSKSYARISTQATTDSVVALPIIYTGNTYPELMGQIPDSIALIAYVTADSTYRIFIRVKSAARYGQVVSAYTSALQDSLVSATAAIQAKRVLIPTPKYFAYDLLGVSLVGGAAIEYRNAVMTANASKVYMRLVRYFHQR